MSFKTFLNDLASATQKLTGSSAPITPSEVPATLNAFIASILQEKTATENGEVTPDEGYYGLSKVTVNVPADNTLLKSICDRSITEYTHDMGNVIGDYFFSSCKSLTKVDLLGGDHLNGNGYIFKNGAFYDCSSLYTLIIRDTENVAEIETSTTFNYTPIGTDHDDAHVYVPTALLEQYKSGYVWSNIKSRLRALEDYTVDGTVTGELDPSKI